MKILLHGIQFMFINLDKSFVMFDGRWFICVNKNENNKKDRNQDNTRKNKPGGRPVMPYKDAAAKYGH